jgi:hypothetical protein
MGLTIERAGINEKTLLGRDLLAIQAQENLFEVVRKPFEDFELSPIAKDMLNQMAHIKWYGSEDVDMLGAVGSGEDGVMAANYNSYVYTSPDALDTKYKVMGVDTLYTNRFVAVRYEKDGSQRRLYCSYRRLKPESAMIIPDLDKKLLPTGDHTNVVMIEAHFDATGKLDGDPIVLHDFSNHPLDPVKSVTDYDGRIVHYNIAEWFSGVGYDEFDKYGSGNFEALKRGFNKGYLERSFGLVALNPARLSYMLSGENYADYGLVIGDLLGNINGAVKTGGNDTFWGGCGFTPKELEGKLEKYFDPNWIHTEKFPDAVFGMLEEYLMSQIDYSAEAVHAVLPIISWAFIQNKEKTLGLLTDLYDNRRRSKVFGNLVKEASIRFMERGGSLGAEELGKVKGLLGSELSNNKLDLLARGGK